MIENIIAGIVIFVACSLAFGLERANRNRAVTEAEPFSAPSHKGYALKNRPEIFGFLDGCALEILLAPTRSTRSWP